MSDARREFPDFDITRSWALPTAPDAGADVSLEAFLKDIGFTDEQLAYTRRSWGNAAGDDISRLSAQVSYGDMTDTSAGVGDYRILDGYTRIHEALAVGLDVRLNSHVESIQWGNSPVKVKLTDGTVYEADQVIVTLPLGVLQANRVRFEPELPEWKQDAIRSLLMGPALKMVYRFDESILPEGVMALYSAQNPPMWWSPTFGHDTNAFAITAFVTGDYARELTAMGESAALEFGLRTLESQLGQELPEPIAARWINWTQDPYSLGGYSAVPVGSGDARDILAKPVGDTLFWAGEATAPNAWSAMVHGAYASGRRAAAEVLVKKEH